MFSGFMKRNRPFLFHASFDVVMNAILQTWRQLKQWSEKINGTGSVGDLLFPEVAGEANADLVRRLHQLNWEHWLTFCNQCLCTLHFFLKRRHFANNWLLLHCLSSNSSHLLDGKKTFKNKSYALIQIFITVVNYFPHIYILYIYFVITQYYFLVSWHTGQSLFMLSSLYPWWESVSFFV